MPAQKFETQIIVRETRHTFHGTNRSGGEYDLWQIIATKPDGTPIEWNLRSFADLPKNEVLDVQCELYVSQQWGNSYTVSVKGGSQTKKKLKELEKRIKDIEDFLSGRGEFRGSAGERDLGPPSAAPPAPPPTPIEQPGAPAHAASEALGQQRDDDIPF